MCKYVPKNWPVDTADQSKQVSKSAKSVYLNNNTLQVTASQDQEGCFKARQMAYLRKKCWI
ncbi:hypothetical protein [Sporomusa sp. KB1]|jgi:hypothetical protein|uniref:hypothetical protein n=1 Tax=Sporomusa sp. KB1 TaxID=943346 RepID=UPI0011AC7065|nr:hypothetical protein [Sporomusa sp. KB1]TWH49202.1 hypothetical protein Salpa_5409 [Sporomusa sp. KB1]